MHFNKDQREAIHKSATLVTAEVMRAIKMVARSRPTDRDLQEAAQKIRQCLLVYANTIMTIDELGNIPDWR
jgi:hypothetical protein